MELERGGGGWGWVGGGGDVKAITRTASAVKNIVQWVPIIGITVNEIIWLMGSNLTRFTTFTSPKLVIYTYCCMFLVHLLIGIIWLMGLL
jgi:hypothetical protein